MLGAYKARVAPFNVNYRYVEDELLYLLTDAQHARHHLPRQLRAAPRGGAAEAAAAGAAAAGRRRQRRAAAARRARLRGGAGRGERRAAAGRRRPRTISTSSTPAARPACRRACSGASTTSSSPPWAGSCRPAWARCRASPSWSSAPRNGSFIRSLPAPPFMHGAAQWIAVHHPAPGRHDRPAEQHPRARPRRHLAHGRARARRHAVDRRRRLRAAAARSARARAPTTSPALQRPRLRRRHPVAAVQGGVPRAAARTS